MLWRKGNRVVSPVVIAHHYFSLLRRWYMSPDLKDGVEPPMPGDEERAFLVEGAVSTRTLKWAQALRGQGTERRFMWWGCSGAEEEGMWDEAGELLRTKSFTALRVKVKTGVLLPKHEKPLRSSTWEEIWSTFPIHFCQKSFIIKPKKKSNWTSSKILKSAHQRHY